MNLAPLALPTAAIGGLFGSFLLGWLEICADEAFARWKLGGVALLGAGAAAWAVGGGRHLAGGAERLGLAALVGVGSAWIVVWASPHLALLVRQRRLVAGDCRCGVSVGCGARQPIRPRAALSRLSHVAGDWHRLACADARLARAIWVRASFQCRRDPKKNWRIGIARRLRGWRQIVLFSAECGSQPFTLRQLSADFARKTRRCSVKA